MKEKNDNGTSGNRIGYKIFSINTTVRNPKRNIEFLELFVPFSGKPFDALAKEKYLAECVKRGVYRFNKIDETVKYKLQNDIELTDAEVRKAFRENPQATGFSNRAVTQLRSLKDQGFLNFVKDGVGKEGAIYEITPLGKALIDNTVSNNDVYTISMISLHGKSPIRETVLNKTRPFLNTLFVMNEVKRLVESEGKEFKGVLLHEFATFILSMKDCNYKDTALEILKYRKKFHNSINKEYMENYIYEVQGMLKVSFKTLTKDYVDDVYRKFELTGLLRKRGVYTNTYIDFSLQNYGKVKQIIENFSNYYWHDFKTKEEYYDFINNIKLPWHDNEEKRLEVLQKKADALGVDISKFKNADEIELYLNEICSQTAISKQVDNYDFKEIIKELLILSGDIDEDSKGKLSGLSEPLRLEFLLALLFGKKFGPENITSNLIYNDDGEPLNFAPGSRSDMYFHSKDLNLVIEATMTRNKTQQINTETTSISRHLTEIKNRTNVEFGLTLVAPYIHTDTCEFFEYKASKNKQKICPLSIQRLVELMQISETPLTFNNNFVKIVEALKENEEDFSNFVNFINSKYLSFIVNKDYYININLKELYEDLIKSKEENKLILS